MLLLPTGNTGEYRRIQGNTLEYKRIEGNTMYLLTEWEGRTGKYLARGQGVRTERSEVRTS